MPHDGWMEMGGKEWQGMVSILCVKVFVWAKDMVYPFAMCFCFFDQKVVKLES